MIERAKSHYAGSFPNASTQRVLSWARSLKPPETESQAAFLAGAALGSLDSMIQNMPPWSGVWRQRLALFAAVASVGLSGRSEGELELRNAFHLTRPGADPGPAGRKLLAWRALASATPANWRSALLVAAETLGIHNDEALTTAIDAAQACVTYDRLPAFAAERAYHVVRRSLTPAAGRIGSEREVVAVWIADAVLAQKFKWPFALPLLSESLFSASGRRSALEKGSEPDTIRFLTAYARAAARACDLGLELARRAQALTEAAPKLRAKGAGMAIKVFLEEDSLGSATPISGLSDRGARRLYERLVSMGAVRELTGRATFRLYGL